MSEPTVEPSWGMFGVKRYIVTGRVQGVGFRWWISGHARDRNLGGHTLNRTDGTVEIVLAGEAMFMGELEELMATGPPLAVVESVSVEDVRPGSIEVPHTFEVLYRTQAAKPRRSLDRKHRSKRLED